MGNLKDALNKFRENDKENEDYKDLLDDLCKSEEREHDDSLKNPGTFKGFKKEENVEESTEKKIGIKENKNYEENTSWKEVVVDKNGQVRQAGATMAEGAFIKGFKKAAEEDLYVFSKGVMGRRYLTKNLHRDICKSLQKVPPFRKMRLLPRDHAKTSIVAHCLPAHINIQPKNNNIYFPGIDGSESRIMLAGEAERRAKANLRVIANAFETNKVLRALWPNKTWEKPRAQSKKWCDEAIILPRENEYPDPTMFAIGVGGAIAGARPTVQIKDDLISLDARNSEIIMETAIEWHRASRALMDEYEKDTGLEGLEFIIGTRWAVYDLYSEILDNDPTVDCETRSILENGNSIWPERFTLEKIEQLRKDHPGGMFYLLYMNSVGDPGLVDFDMELIRSYNFIDGGNIEFDINECDGFLIDKLKRKGTTVDQMPSMRGQKLTPETFSILFGGVEKGRNEYFKYQKNNIRIRSNL